jgi:hypothetical protein
MEQNSESKGALIGSIVIVLILIVGGIYFAKQAGQEINQSEIDQVLDTDPEIQAATESQGSDEILDLDNDLENIDIEDLDIDLDSLEF